MPVAAQRLTLTPEEKQTSQEPAPALRAADGFTLTGTSIAGIGSPQRGRTEPNRTYWWQNQCWFGTYYLQNQTWFASGSPVIAPTTVALVPVCVL